MKKFLKGLRYFLCYVAITLSTAVGVVVYQSNSAGSVSNGNLAGSTVGQVENNLMEVVTNLMDLESFNVNSSVSLTDTTKPSSTPIDIDFNIDINLGTGFSSIEADGVFDIALDNKTFDVAIRFVDNTFYVSALDQDIQFTASGLVEGIGGVLALLDVDLPLDSSLMENFDVTALLGYMGEYKEVETETGYNINLEFMGYDIAMVCDNLFNLNSVVIENMAIEGFKIDLNLGLETYEQKVEITKPQHSFINLDTVTSLVNMTQDVLENNFVMADISASYEGINLDFNAKADFSDNFIMSLTTPAFDGINFSFKNGSLYANVGNLKVKGRAADISTIIDFVNGDLRANIESISPEIVETITSKTNEITSSISNELKNIDANKLLDYIDYLTISDNQIIIDIPSTAKVVIDIESGYITSITANAYGVDLTIDNISFEKQAIEINTNDFVDFDKVFPTFKTFVNTLFTKGISGTMTFGRGNKTNSLNYGIRYTNHFETSFDTTILNKTVSVVSDNSKVYLMVDGIKVNVDLAEYQTIIDYINETFNQNISLPSFEMPEIDPYTMVVGAISSIDYLKAIDSGIELSIGGIVIQIISNENYIQTLNVKYNDYSFALNITGYGEVELFDIDKDDYLVFSDLTNYVDKATSFANSTSFNMHLGIMADINGTDITAMADGRVGLNGNVEATVTTTVNDFGLDFSMALTDDALGLTYDGLNVYAKQSSIGALTNIIKNIVPNYVNIDSLLQQNNIDLDKTLSSDIKLPAIDTKQLILAVKRLNLNKDTLTAELDCSEFTSGEKSTAIVVVRMVNGGYELRIGLVYNDIVINLYLKLTSTEDFTASIPADAIDVEDYLNLVEYMHNTIDSRNLALDVTATIDQTEIVAKVLADFRSTLKVKATTESLGSKLDVVYASDINKLLVTFGDIKISGKSSDLADILNFVKVDLNNALLTYGEKALSKVNFESLTQSKDTTITFEDIKDILHSITFGDDTISFVKDNIVVTLTITNKSISNIKFAIDNIVVNVGVSDNTQAITYTTAGYSAFENILDNLKAITNVATSQAFGGKVTITYNKDKTYTGNLKVNYINNVLSVHVDSNVYDQDISIDIIGSIVYVKLNELKLQVSWAERYALQEYLNSKFDLQLDIDAIFNMAKGVASSTKDFSLDNINIDFISNFVANKNGLDITVSDIPVSLGIAKYGDTDKNYLSYISAGYDKFDISINEMTFGQDAIVNSVNATEYHKYTDFTKYFDEIERLINASKDSATDQYTLKGGIKLYKLDANGNALVTDGVADEITISINDLKFDATKNTFIGGIDAKGSGSLYESYLSGYDHSFDAAYDYNFIYFDYNGLRAKFSKQSNSEFITTLKKMLPTYLGDTPLTRQLVSIFDMIRFDTMGNMLFNPVKLDVTYNMIEQFAPMLSTLKLEENGSLTIGLDISTLDPTFKEELLLNVSIDESGRLALVINKFKLTKDLAIDFTIYVDTASTFTVNPEGDYLDMTSIGKLLSDFDNTAQKTTTDNEVYKLNLSGSFHLKIAVSFIKINEDIPFKAQLIIDRNSNQLIEAKIEVDMPSIILVTDGCYSTLYLTNRLEGENILYIDRQGKDPLKSKYKVSELGANLLNVISDITAISSSTLETFMTMDIKYIDGPSKAENVLKDYSCVTGINTRDYTIGLDLRQITRMDMMLGYSASNPTGVVIHSQNNAFSSIDINNITLEAISNVFIYVNGTIDLTKINQTSDIIGEIENLDATLYGSWGDGSLVADFIENGGSNVPNKMGTTGRSFTLPVPVKEVVNGNTLEVYKFLGWSLNSDGSGELYNGKYMFETSSLTFYAVWELDTVYTSRTINFVTEYLMANGIDSKVENNISSITNYNGYDISNSLPTISDTVTIYYEDEGVSITYRYDGLFKTRTVNSDGTIVYSDKFDQTVMPNEDLTLYASFVEIDRVYKRKLTILDESKTLYEGYFVEGDVIDILSLVAYKDTTRWYDDYDATATTRYTNEILTVDLPTTMPRGNDLSLYVRNKYTITYTSNFGDKKTYTQTDYQGEPISLPTQTSYENIVYKEEKDSDGNKIPNYLSTFVYEGYTLSTDSSVAVPSVIPSKNATYAAKWSNITTSYVKVTFSSPWVKPSAWWFGCSQEVAPRGTLVRYVLNGSTLNNTTLSKKTSIIGLTANEDENISDYCVYKYAIKYKFSITVWNKEGAKNHNTGSATAKSWTITGDTTFYGEWECTGIV